MKRKNDESTDIEEEYEEDEESYEDDDDELYDDDDSYDVDEDTKEVDTSKYDDEDDIVVDESDYSEDEKPKKRKTDDYSSGLSMGAKIAIVVVIAVTVILILLKACNNKSEYTVKFDVDGGTEVSDQIVKKNEKVTPPSDPTKDGYEFEGWYLNGKKYDFDSKVTSDLVIEARWTNNNTADVEGVSLDQEEVGLRMGDETQLIATVEPSDAKDKTVTWKSSDESVVKVDEDGNIKAVSNGSATITVTTNEGGFVATCRVVVSDDIVKVTGLKVDKKEVTVYVDDTVRISADVEPAEATNNGLIWTSEDTSIASVSSTGVIRGKKEGKTTVTVKTKDGDFSEEIKVTVKEVELEKISISGDTKINIGDTTTLKAKLEPYNATVEEITWKSDNENVATVDKNGKVTGKKSGTARITVIAKLQDGKDEMKASVKIEVVKPVEVTSIEISPSKLELVEDQTAKLKVTIKPDNAANKNFQWSNSNADVVSVTGGVVTAKKAGKATITVTSADNDKLIATCEITVKAKETPKSNSNSNSNSESNSNSNSDSNDNKEESNSNEVKEDDTSSKTEEKEE